MSNVLLEAAATGRPVITSDIPGCREAVDPDVSGMLCKVQDPDTLYDCMERMLKLPAASRAAMGIAGRGKMEREFAKEQVVAETIQGIF
jgi:glycosyltransferase involved in cell wall biosynthesis